MQNALKQIWSYLISMKLMVALVLVFAFSCAVATFIENDHGRDTAWALVYGAQWFEIVQILLGVSIVGNIIKYKIYQMKKMPAFIFHVAFLIILIGSGITRYFGYEGVIHIREGQSENRMLSSDGLLQISATKGGEEYYDERVMYLSAIGGNGFTKRLDVDGDTLKVSYKGFMPKAAKTAVEDPAGEPIIVFVIPTPAGPEKYFLKSGTMENVGPFTVYFDKAPDTNSRYVSISSREGKFEFTSNMHAAWLKMADQSSGIYPAGATHEFNDRRLYTFDGTQMATKAVLEKGVVKVIEEDAYKKSMKMNMNFESLSALIVDVEYKGETKEVALMGKGSRYKGFAENFTIDGTDITLEWGSKQLELPFSLYLRDFVMEKYPGSMSPSSYESHVTLIDDANNVREQHRIYMNHVLDYGGFMFFQSSFDRDEQGTILSVNHDPGKWPTYLGYTLLAIGMFINFFNPHGRFGKLARTKYTGTAKSVAIAIAFVAAMLTGQPAQAATNNGHDHASHAGKPHKPDMAEIEKYLTKIDAEHAKKFGTILVQDRGGRIKPLDSLTLDLVNKIADKKQLLGLSNNQVVLGMAIMSSYWQQIPMFKTVHPEVRKALGMAKDQKHFSYMDIFDQSGQYKIGATVQESIRKRPAERSKFDKELIKIDERLNIAYYIYNGDFFRSFPLVSDPENKWYTPGEFRQSFPYNEQMKVIALLTKQQEGLMQGITAGNWEIADAAVDDIIAYQKENGAAVIPSDTVINLEMLYNELAIFERLYPVYLIAGLILMLMIFIRLAKPSLNLTLASKIVLTVLVLGFIAHTANLGLRWYISGHAPWSDGYESMIYIAWTIILAGIIFAKQSEFAIASTGILSGLTLFVAHLSWLDPQITNLVPVLKSYWLTIHVSIITSSYGFLGLSALLGFISLILFIMLGRVKSHRTKEEITLSIKEAARINEMSMIIGLCLITVGNFLGGVWANESWGRYWGWDPKETWALITILVYVAIVHIRFIPKLYSHYLFSVVSLVGYSSVIMTYFGVNYYLSGLHSYASGDPVPVPVWVYYAIAIIGAIIALAYANRNAMVSPKKQAS